jgi:hypothetical protein
MVKFNSNGEEKRKMKNRARIFLLAAPMLFLSFICTGCIVGRYYEGPNIVAERVRDIKPGVTTKEEIIAWFGPPQNYLSPTVFNKILQDLDITGEPLGTFPFANILSYQYDQANIRALVLVLFNYAEAKVKSDHLVVFLDENERVKYYGFYRGTEEL